MAGDGENPIKRQTSTISRDVVGDDDLADEFEDMNLDEYAQHKGIEIVNQGKRSLKMAKGNGRTKQDLLDEIGDLQQENQALQDQLDAIADIVTPEEPGKMTKRWR